MILTFKTMPLSTNALHGVFKGRKIISAKGRVNKAAIGWEARAQYRGKPLAGPIKVEIDLYWPTRRNHDIDNIKTLLDSLTGIVWEDDGQIIDLHTRKFYDKGQPRVMLTVLSRPG